VQEINALEVSFPP